MPFKVVLKFGWKFLALKPTIGQIANAMKYSYAFFTDRFDHKVTFDPMSIGFYITYNCNLQCPYCWNPMINLKENRNKNLTTDEILSVLTHPRLKNAVRVSFVGGEPLAHPQIFEFIELCKKHKKMTMFPSNGLLISKRLDKLRDSSLTAIQISLYDGLVEKQLENVAKLREVNKNVEIELARFVTNEKKSLEYMHAVVGFAKDLGVNKVCFQNFQPQDKKDAHLSIYDDHTDILQHFEDMKKKAGKNLEIMFPAPLKRDVSKRFCYDLYTAIFIGKGGDIAPCSSIVPPKKQFGNVFDEDFWNNKYFQSHRKNYNSKFPFHPTCEFCYESSKHMRNFV